MKKVLFFVFLAAILSAACRTCPPVHNIEHQPVAIQDIGLMRKAILAGASNKGWEVTEIGEGLIKAVLNVRAHQVVVEIPYGADYYSIIYKDSKNLRYNKKKGTIHPRYNTWIVYLQRSINAQLGKM